MYPIVHTYMALLGAIVLEILGTGFLQASHQFTRPVPTLIMVLCYSVSFYFLSIVLKTMPVGLAYATWSGIGICLIALTGFIVFKQKLDAPAMLGIAMITIGIIIINLYSETTAH